MKILLLQNSSYFDFKHVSLLNQVVDLSDFSLPKTYKKSHEQEIPAFEWALSQIQIFAQSNDILVISNLLFFDNENYLKDEKDCRLSAFDFALHIRLHQNQEVRNFPIVILSFKELSEIFSETTVYPQILKTEGIFLINPNFISQQPIQTWVKPPENKPSRLSKSTRYISPTLLTIEELVGICNKEQVKKSEHIFQKTLYIRSYDTSNHDIANEWGAYRMAQVAGIEKEIDYIYPKTLFFKYLISSIDLSETFDYSKYVQFWERDLKVLFIDDKYENGWQQCLEGVFRKRILKDGKNITIESKSLWNESYLPDIKNDKYDLILLDYYISDKKGIEILPKIKEANPAVPVIMFTASNKAWNMDKLYEAGADGYYVKEHPDNAHDADFSVENFKNFHETVEKCLKKGKLLRKYWSKINDIKNSPQIQNKILSNGSGQKNKERIEERLTMFLGLLKKAFEQTKFDEDTFFYSEWELAFLTLWSTLNEIQEVYYEKNSNFIPFSYTPISGGSQHKNKHPNNNSTIGTSVNWKISGTNDYLTIYKPKFDSSGQPVLKSGSNFYDMVPYTTIFLDDNSLSKFRIEPNYQRVNLKNDRYNYSGNLFMQIAFLISKIIPSNTVINRDILLFYVFECNEERNKLYLTHGDNSSSPNFAVLYQDHRKSDTDWQTHIEKLFRIVYFLCTGQECIW